MNKTRRILALHWGALGDFVLSWPALGLLLAGPPLAELELVGRPDWGSLILPREKLHHRESARLAGLFSQEPSAELDAWLASFDLAVVFAARPLPELEAHLRAAGVGQVWRAPTRPPEGELAHAGDMQVEYLRGQGLTGPASPPMPRLSGPPQAPAPVIAPGSGGRAKRLAPELVGRLAAGVPAGVPDPVLVLGPAEDPDYRLELSEVLANTRAQVLADPGIMELARRLAGAAPYLGPDSGVTHLAASLGAPTLAGFGASDPRIWAPRGPRARVLAWQELESAWKAVLAG